MSHRDRWLTCAGRPYGCPEPALGHTAWQFTDGTYRSRGYTPPVWPAIGRCDTGVIHQPRAPPRWRSTCPPRHRPAAPEAGTEEVAVLGHPGGCGFVFHIGADTSAIINGAVVNSQPVIWITGFANGVGTWS